MREAHWKRSKVMDQCSGSGAWCLPDPPQRHEKPALRGLWWCPGMWYGENYDALTTTTTSLCLSPAPVPWDVLEKQVQRTTRKSYIFVHTTLLFSLYNSL